MAHYEDLYIDQGADVAVEVHLVETDGSAKNLNGYSAAAKMKVNYNSDSGSTTVFSTHINDPADQGVLTLSLTNQQTDALRPSIRYVYDVEISFVDSDQNTMIERVLEGRVYVNPSVTR